MRLKNDHLEEVEYVDVTAYLLPVSIESNMTFKDFVRNSSPVAGITFKTDHLKNKRMDIISRHFRNLYSQLSDKKIPDSAIFLVSDFRMVDEMVDKPHWNLIVPIGLFAASFWLFAILELVKL
jgi:hypothetical protein